MGKLPNGVFDVNGDFNDPKLGSFSRRHSLSHRTQIRKAKNFRIDIVSDPLIIDTRAGEVNKTFTGLLQATLNEQFDAITKKVSVGTKAQREKMFRSSTANKKYKKRYAGGRIGELKPSPTSDIYMKDSGRLQRTVINLRNKPGAAGISGAIGNRHSRGVATINVPANRLDPVEFGDEAQFQEFVRTMRELLPILSGKSSPATKAKIDKGMVALMEGMVENSEKRYNALIRRRNRVIRQLLRSFGINADVFAFTQQIRIQRGVRQGQRLQKETVG